MNVKSRRDKIIVATSMIQQQNPEGVIYYKLIIHTIQNNIFHQIQQLILPVITGIPARRFRFQNDLPGVRYHHILNRYENVSYPSRPAKFSKPKNPGINMVKCSRHNCSFLSIHVTPSGFGNLIVHEYYNTINPSGFSWQINKLICRHCVHK